MSLKDVARMAGVSVITASRALDPEKSGLVGEETRRRVRDAAEKIGHACNTSARRFKKGRTEVIAMAVPARTFVLHEFLDFSAHSGVLFWQLAEGVLKEARRMRHDIKLEPCFEASDVDGFMAETGPACCDGVIFVGTEDFLPMIEKTRGVRPFVIMTTQPSDVADALETSCDPRPGVAEAVRHLAETGRKKIALLSLEDVRRCGRMTEFKNALSGAGLFREELVFQAANIKEIRALVAEKRRKLPFDAVVCHNDAVARHMVEELNQAGIRTPKDAAVVGFDGNPAYLDELSTVFIDRRALGELAVSSLLDMINGRGPARGKILIPTKFRRGASS